MKRARGRNKSSAPSRQHLPGLSTNVNWTAGINATGIRTGFPAARRVALNYCDIITLSAETGLVQNHFFSLNNAYDPDVTAIGHQPMGFDQYALFYNHYVVEECSYDVSISTNSNHPSNYMLGLYDDTVIPASFSERMELGGVIASNNPYVPAHIFKGTLKVDEYFRRGNANDDSSLRTPTTTSPVEQVYLAISLQSADRVASSVAYATVKLRYTITFSEPKDLGPSLANIKTLPPPIADVPPATTSVVRSQVDKIESRAAPECIYPVPSGYVLVPDSGA